MAIVITGTSRGIGAALKDAYQETGAAVIGTTRGATDLGHRLDVTDPDSVSAFAQALDGTAVDLLICNAGVYLDKGMKLADGYPAEAWAQTFAANVTGVFLVIQALLPNLQMSDRPRIAIISSAMGSSTRAHGGSYIYRASKAAAINLARNLAADLTPIGIAMGVYHPGWVQTDMGGENADIPVSEAVAGLMTRFEALDTESSGCFETWDGRPLQF